MSNDLRLSFAALAASLMVAGLASACLRPDETSQADRSAPGREFSVQYDFDADSAERLVLDSLLQEVALQLGVGHLAGTLMDFSTPGEQRNRYLLDLIAPQDLRDGEILLITLRTGAAHPGISPIYGTGVAFAPRSLSIEAIDDYDDDGVPDVAYCVWPRAEGTQGDLRLVGFREGAWYPIDAKRAIALTCDPAA